MTDRELTQEERDKLPEDALVEHDLRHVKRDPRIPRETQRHMIRDRTRRERRQRKQDAADLALAERFGTTLHAIREERERRVAEQARKREAARVAVAKMALDGATGEHIGLDVTREQIETVRDSLEAAGQDHGYKTLADYFDVSMDTIRRRLGRRSPAPGRPIR